MYGKSIPFCIGGASFSPMYVLELHVIDNLRQNLYKYLFTNLARDLYREMSDRGLFLHTVRVGRGLYKKTKVLYFLVKTEQAMLIKVYYME